MLYTKQQMINLYKNYGYDFPLKAQYKRQNNRIYFVSNFKDNEIIEFSRSCEKPSACAIGNAFYVNEDGTSNLVNINELEPMNE